MRLVNAIGKSDPTTDAATRMRGPTRSSAMRTARGLRWS
jgi:hypothetical protein